ncbi:hypothetical protein BDB01DRAFT_806541 [Pilobolus umbonatus]|nr:hypothetical protein BDB01DRAFT_806541 [Pilobolus umbonatus]
MAQPNVIKMRVHRCRDIHKALEHSPMKGVYNFTKTIWVPEEEWRKCLVEIGKLCFMKWYQHHSTKEYVEPSEELILQARMINDNTSFYYRQNFICHRSYNDNKKPRSESVYSCNAQVRVTFYYRHPTIVELKPINQHTSHIPGIEDDFIGDHKTLMKRMELFLYLNEDQRKDLVATNHPNIRDILFYLVQFITPSPPPECHQTIAYSNTTYLKNKSMLNPLKRKLDEEEEEEEDADMDEEEDEEEEEEEEDDEDEDEDEENKVEVVQKEKAVVKRDQMSVDIGSRIDNYLNSNQSIPRRAKLDMLNYMNQHGRPFERRFPCRDRNKKMLKIAKKLYLFHEDERESMLLWYSDYLKTEDYLVYDEELDTDDDSFVSGFISPLQQECLKTCMKVCLVATTDIGIDGDMILYSLIIYEHGRIYPACYMFTNSPYIQAVIQWMSFLKENQLLLSVKEIVTDCELLTMEGPDQDIQPLIDLFPDCKISYSLCHVIHDLVHLLSQKLKMSGDQEINIECLELRGIIMTELKDMIWEEDKDKFTKKLSTFESNYQSPAKFMRHFKKWHTNRIWNAAYCPFPMADPLVSQSIEIWRTHLNSLYLNRCTEKRIDRLICILTISAKEQLGEEAEREIDQIQSLATKISPVEREQMILKKPSYVSDSSKGRYIVMSLMEEDLGYEVVVDNNTMKIVSCNCYQVIHFDEPCAHMYLFELEYPDYHHTEHMNEDKEEDQLKEDLDLMMIESGSFESPSEELPIDTVLGRLSDIMDINSTLYMERDKAFQFSEVMTAEEIDALYNHAEAYMNAFQQAISKCQQ